MAMDPNQGPAMPAPAAGDGSGGGLPPELMALLQGGGGAPDASTGPEESAPGDSADASAGGDESPVDLINQMIEAAKRYIEVEPDEEDKLTMTKVMQQLQQYLAKDQKEGEEMLQGKLSPRAVRRASVGG